MVKIRIIFLKAYLIGKKLSWKLPTKSCHFSDWSSFRKLTTNPIFSHFTFIWFYLLFFSPHLFPSCVLQQFFFLFHHRCTRRKGRREHLMYPLQNCNTNAINHSLRDHSWFFPQSHVPPTTKRIWKKTSRTPSPPSVSTAHLCVIMFRIIF